MDGRKRRENGSVDVKLLLRFQWNENGVFWKRISVDVTLVGESEEALLADWHKQFYFFLQQQQQNKHLFLSFVSQIKFIFKMTLIFKYLFPLMMRTEHRFDWSD